MQFRLPAALTVRWARLNPMHFQKYALQPYALLQLLLYFLPMSGVSGGIEVEILPGNRPDDPLLS